MTKWGRLASMFWFFSTWCAFSTTSMVKWGGLAEEGEAHVLLSYSPLIGSTFFVAIRSNTVNLFDGYFELFFGFLMRREMRLYSPLIASMFFVATRSENLFDGSFELFLGLERFLMRCETHLMALDAFSPLIGLFPESIWHVTLVRKHWPNLMLSHTWGASWLIRKLTVANCRVTRYVCSMCR